MKLHYYATEAALAALWHNKIKVTAPCDFNDPMEFLPATKDVTDESRSFRTNFRETSRNKFFALSMSHRDDSARMWAQYGGNHSGLMFTLDFDRGSLAKFKDAVREVKYDNQKRHVVDLKNIKTEDVFELLTRKGKDWEHEEEWRLLLASSMVDDVEYDLFRGYICPFISLADKSICSVTLGQRSSLALADSLSKIREIRKADWGIFKSKLHDHDFLLINERIS